MARSILRSSSAVSLLALISWFSVFACGGSEPTTPTAADTPPPSTPAEDAGPPPPAANEVIVKLANVYGAAEGTRTERPPTRSSVGRIVATVDGAQQVFASTARGDSTLVFTDVPTGPYVLELSVTYAAAIEGDPPVILRYPIDGARTVDLGDEIWARHDVVTMDEATTKLALSVGLPQGLEEGDTFSWVGVRSYFYRTAGFYEGEQEGVLNPPAVGATQTANWTFDANVLGAPYTYEASGLPTPTDDLLVLQNRSSQITTPHDADPRSRFEPWRTIDNDSVIGMLRVPSPSFTNGATNTVTGALTTPPTETFPLDFRGSSYATLRALARYPKTTTSNARVSLSQEAGTGPKVYSSSAPSSWSIRARSRREPIDLGCFPDPESTACDPSTCSVPCGNTAFDGYLDPGDSPRVELTLPHLVSEGLRDFLAIGYSFSYPLTLADGSTRYLSAGVNEFHPRSGSAPTIQLEVPPPLDVTVNGAVLPWEISVIPEGTPVVAFRAATGAEYYRIELLDVTPDLDRTVDEPRTSLRVALLNTKETSMTLPQEVLRSGHTYYLRVASVRDGWNFADPPLRSQTAQTAVFTPAFRYGR